MISCFPDPLPDELFFSACARFSARVQYPNKKAVLKELFGKATCTATVELPSHLSSLIWRLAPGDVYKFKVLERP